MEEQINPTDFFLKDGKYIDVRILVKDGENPDKVLSQIMDKFNKDEDIHIDGAIIDKIYFHNIDVEKSIKEKKEELIQEITKKVLDF